MPTQPSGWLLGQPAVRPLPRRGQRDIDYGGWNWRNDFLTFEDEVVYMREWMQDRWAFVDKIY